MADGDKKPEQKGITIEQHLFLMAGKVDALMGQIQAIKAQYEQTILDLAREIEKRKPSVEG